jgi:septal ring-binding cell division protein DamX
VETSAATVTSETETPAIDQSQPAVATEQPIKTPTEPVAPIEPITNTATVTEPQTEPVVTSVQTSRTPDDNNIFNLANIPAQVNGIRGNSWYRSQPRTSYTLQLISASRIENVVEILEDVPGIQAELSGYVKYTPSGKSRYLMFYGLYADKAAADAAISNGPAGGEPLVTFNR